MPNGSAASLPYRRFKPTQLRRSHFEFRHESWFTDETYAVLREHNAALCIAESDDLLTPEVHTAEGHTCYRLRRDGGYSALELDAFAKRFTSLTAQRDVTCTSNTRTNQPAHSTRPHSLRASVRMQASNDADSGA